MSPGVVDDHHLHSRGPVVVGHPFGVDEIPYQSGIQAAQSHVTASGGSHGPGEAPPVAVEHGKGPQVGGLGRQARDDHLVERIEIGAPISVLHSFRTTGRARGVIYRDCLLLVLESAGGWLGRRLLEELLIFIDRTTRACTADHRAYSSDRSSGVTSGSSSTSSRRNRSPPLADVPDLAAREPVVDRHQNSPSGGDAEVGLQHGRRVEQQGGDAVPFAKASPGQAVGSPGACSAKS